MNKQPTFDIWIKARAFEWNVSRVNEAGERQPPEPSGYLGAYLYREDGTLYKTQIPLGEVTWVAEEQTDQDPIVVADQEMHGQ